MKAPSYAKYAGVKLQELTQPKPAFLADAMLGSVARKLRVFGFDTSYHPDIRDEEILRIAMKENRVLLTADRELFKRGVKAGVQGVLLGKYEKRNVDKKAGKICNAEKSKDIKDLIHLLSKCRITCIDLKSVESRCSVCNGSLVSKSSQEVENDLPAGVVHSFNKFFKCMDCAKIYWEGSHYRRIGMMARRIDTVLKAGAN